LAARIPGIDHEIIADRLAIAIEGTGANIYLRCAELAFVVEGHNKTSIAEGSNGGD